MADYLLFFSCTTASPHHIVLPFHFPSPYDPADPLQGPNLTPGEGENINFTKASKHEAWRPLPCHKGSVIVPFCLPPNQRCLSCARGTVGGTVPPVSCYVSQRDKGNPARNAGTAFNQPRGKTYV